MRKRIEPTPLPQPQLQQHTFARARRTWQHTAVLASRDFTPSHSVRPSRATGAPTWSDASSWILRQRLN